MVRYVNREIHTYTITSLNKSCIKMICLTLKIIFNASILLKFYLVHHSFPSTTPADSARHVIFALLHKKLYTCKIEPFPRPKKFFKDMIAALVAKGTITAAQGRRTDSRVYATIGSSRIQELTTRSQKTLAVLRDNETCIGAGGKYSSLIPLRHHFYGGVSGTPQSPEQRRNTPTLSQS